MRGLSSAVFVVAVLAVASEDHHQKELKDHYHHLAYIAEFDCHWPQPRVISVHDLFPEKDIKHKAFFPDVTVLYRCDSAAGCCPSNHVCRPKHSYPLHLPFKVTFLEHMHEHKKGSWIIDYHTFDNHTECECVEHHYEHSHHEHHYEHSHHEPDHHLEHPHKDHHDDSYHHSDNPHKDHHDDSYHHSDYPQKDHQDDSYYKHSEYSYKTDRRSSTRKPDYTQREPNLRPNYSSSATPEDISTPTSSSPDFNEQQESSTTTTTTTGKIDERDFSSYFN